MGLTIDRKFAQICLYKQEERARHEHALQGFSNFLSTILERSHPSAVLRIRQPQNSRFVRGPTVSGEGPGSRDLANTGNRTADGTPRRRPAALQEIGGLEHHRGAGVDTYRPQPRMQRPSFANGETTVGQYSAAQASR